MRFNKLSASLAATATVVTGALMTATPAPAAPAGCGSGMGCTYEDANYGKGHINFYQNVWDFGGVAYWAPTGHLITDNAASSAFNNGTTGASATWFDRKNYSGPAKTLTKGNGTAHLGNAGLNDKISSACFAGYCK